MRNVIPYQINHVIILIIVELLNRLSKFVVDLAFCIIIFMTPNIFHASIVVTAEKILQFVPYLDSPAVKSKCYYTIYDPAS